MRKKVAAAILVVLALLTVAIVLFPNRIGVCVVGNKTVRNELGHGFILFPPSERAIIERVTGQPERTGERLRYLPSSYVDWNRTWTFLAATWGIAVLSAGLLVSAKALDRINEPMAVTDGVVTASISSKNTGTLNDRLEALATALESVDPADRDYWSRGWGGFDKVAVTPLSTREAMALSGRRVERIEELYLFLPLVIQRSAICELWGRAFGEWDKSHGVAPLLFCEAFNRAGKLAQPQVVADVAARKDSEFRQILPRVPSADDVNWGSIFPEEFGSTQRTKRRHFNHALTRLPQFASCSSEDIGRLADRLSLRLELHRVGRLPNAILEVFPARCGANAAAICERLNGKLAAAATSSRLEPALFLEELQSAVGLPKLSGTTSSDLYRLAVEGMSSPSTRTRIANEMLAIVSTRRDMSLRDIWRFEWLTALNLQERLKLLVKLARKGIRF